MSNSQVSTLEAPARGAAQRQPAQAAASTQPTKAKSNGHDVALSGKKASITVHAGEGENGQDAVFVGLNGFGYQIPRGEPWEVPVEVLMILENAVTEILSTDKGGAVKSRTAPRYSLTVHSVDRLDA